MKPARMSEEDRSRAGRAVAAHLAVLALMLLAINIGATQYLAQALGHDPALGAPLWKGFYAPWRWIEWTLLWRLEHPALFDRALAFSAFAAVAAFSLYAFAVLFFTRRSTGLRNLHGSARFAGRADLIRAGLLPRSGKSAGVYVGGWSEGRAGRMRFLRHNGPEHVLAIAPTRSGKTAGLVIPTLATWPASVVAWDIKGELFALTAPWRKIYARQTILKFAPAEEKGSVRFNPLEELRAGTVHDVQDAQNIAEILVSPDGGQASGESLHWNETAAAFLTGAILHEIYAARAEERVATLASLALLLTDPARPLTDTLQAMIEAQHIDGKPHPVAAQAAREVLNKSDKERSGVISTALRGLKLYRDPIVAANTACSDFRIRDLVEGEAPASLYIVTPPSDKDRLKPLIRLLMTQILRTLTRDGVGKDAQKRHRLLLMIDEFPSLGRLPVFEESLAYLAGYGIKAFLVIQDFSQLWAAYGKTEAITSNCHIRAAFAPNRLETAEILSRMTGVATVVRERVQTSGRRLSPILGQVSTSFQETGRPLMTPDEILRMPGAETDGAGKVIKPGDMLIFAAGHPPVYGRQIFYFLDPVFQARTSLGVSVKGDQPRERRAAAQGAAAASALRA